MGLRNNFFFISSILCDVSKKKHVKQSGRNWSSEWQCWGALTASIQLVESPPCALRSLFRLFLQATTTTKRLTLPWPQKKNLAQTFSSITFHCTSNRHSFSPPPAHHSYAFGQSCISVLSVLYLLIMPTICEVGTEISENKMYSKHNLASLTEQMKTKQIPESNIACRTPWMGILKWCLDQGHVATRSILV